MRPIQMVDLKQQYAKIKPEIDTALQDVLDTAAFINGKPVQDFTQALSAYLDVKHVIPCANGTDALQIALMALGSAARRRSNYTIIYFYCHYRSHRIA